MTVLPCATHCIHDVTFHDEVRRKLCCRCMGDMNRLPISGHDQVNGDRDATPAGELPDPPIVPDAPIDLKLTDHAREVLGMAANADADKSVPAPAELESSVASDRPVVNIPAGAHVETDENGNPRVVKP